MTRRRTNLLQDPSMLQRPQGPSRRRFLRHLAAGSAAVGGLGLLAGCGGSDDDDDDNGPAPTVGFAHGVASGDPLSDRVILWTRLSTDASGEVELRWEVAADEAFTTVVAEGRARTDASVDHTVKVDATGLRAATRYWYRFSVGDQRSPVGRTRTLPTGAVDQVRLAVFSCANYPTGYFNVYAHAAQRGDLDAAVHLGDYLYEYERGGYASESAAALGREVVPADEIVTLTDYRTRHAQYKTDDDLQALHAALPMIAVWDDHEITNDTWREGAENHDASEGDFDDRKAAALQAYHEWMPTRTRTPELLYRSFDFGTLLSLHMLDTRVIGRDEQLSYTDFIGGSGFDADGFGAALVDPNRQLLGAPQTQWLQGQLQASTATWQVLGQQVLMGRMAIPAPIALQTLSVADYAALVQRAQTNPSSLTPADLAVLAQPAVPYNLDAWDGYAVARETVLGMARDLDKNLVVLAGDTHNAWANDLLDGNGVRVGVEFATPSVTSPGFEAYLPNEAPEVLAATLTQLIGPLQYCDTAQRGYLVITATPEACQGDWVYVDGIDTRSATARIERSLRTLAGAAGRRLVEADAPV